MMQKKQLAIYSALELMRHSYIFLARLQPRPDVTPWRVYFELASYVDNFLRYTYPKTLPTIEAGCYICGILGS